MAFPTVQSVVVSSRTSDALNDVVTLPANIASGELVIVFHGSDGAATPITRTFPNPWVEIKDTQNNTNNFSIGVAYLIATGGETSVTVTKSVAERFSALACRITGWHGSMGPEISTGVSGSSTQPNPDAVTASWGSADNLFFAIAVMDNATAGRNFSAFPANYASNNHSSPDIPSAARVGIATRNLAGASDDPGTFTISASNTWWAATLVVSPPSDSTTVSVTGLAMTATVGNEAVTGDANVSLSGNPLASAAGAPSVTGNATVNVTGITLTASVGTVDVQITGDVQVFVIGNVVTTVVGNESITAGAVVTPIGLLSALSVGVVMAVATQPDTPLGIESVRMFQKLSIELVRSTVELDYVVTYAVGKTGLAIDVKRAGQQVTSEKVETFV